MYASPELKPTTKFSMCRVAMISLSSGRTTKYDSCNSTVLNTCERHVFSMEAEMRIESSFKVSFRCKTKATHHKPNRHTIHNLMPFVLMNIPHIDHNNKNSNNGAHD